MIFARRTAEIHENAPKLVFQAAEILAKREYSSGSQIPQEAPVRKIVVIAER